MKRSALWRFNLRDIIRGLILAVITAVVIFLNDLIASGWNLEFTKEIISQLVNTIWQAFLAYLGLNFMTGKKGQLLKDGIGEEVERNITTRYEREK